MASGLDHSPEVVAPPTADTQIPSMHKREVAIAAIEEVFGSQAAYRCVVHGHAGQSNIRAALGEVDDGHVQMPQAPPEVLLRTD